MYHLHPYYFQVLRNAVGVGGCQLSRKKAFTKVYSSTLEDHILHLVIPERPSPARLKSRRPFAEHAHRLLRSTPEDVCSRSWLSTRWNEEWRAAEHSRLHSFINTPDHVPGQDLPRRQWTTCTTVSERV